MILSLSRVTRQALPPLLCALLVWSCDSGTQIVLTSPDPETPLYDEPVEAAVSGDSTDTTDSTGLLPQFLDPESLDNSFEGGSTGDGLSANSFGDDGWTSTNTVPSRDTVISSVGDGTGAIEINRLSEVSPDSIGTLTLETGGLPSSLWHGTRFDTVLELVTRLPAETRSPALRRIIRRLLVSEAEPPSGVFSDGEFMAKRLEVLSALGETKAGNALLAIIPGRRANRRLARLESESALVEGRFVEACGQASSAVRRETVAAYWQKLLIFCQVLAGSHAEAELGISLMREIGTDDETLLLMLESMMREDTLVLNSLENQTPLHMAVLRASNTRLDPDSADVLSPAMLAAIAANQDLDMSMRLQAAERAATFGALSVTAHRELIMAVPFTPEQMENPVTAAESLPGNMARALLYQAAKSQPVHSVRAEAAALAFDLARDDDLYASTAGMFLDVTAGIPPRTDLVWFAGDAIRAFALANNGAGALGWLRMLEGNVYRLDEARGALIDLVPVTRLAGLTGQTDTPGQPVGIADWVQAVSVDAGYRQKAAFLFAVLDGLQEPVDAELWQRLGLKGQMMNDSDQMMSDSAGPPEQGSRDPAMPDTVLWYRLSNAALDGRLGETVLLAALMLGDADPDAVDSITMGNVVRNLNAAGLIDEAREIAIEGAIARGL